MMGHCRWSRHESCHTVLWVLVGADFVRCALRRLVYEEWCCTAVLFLVHGMLHDASSKFWQRTHQMMAVQHHF